MRKDQFHANIMTYFSHETLKQSIYNFAKSTRLQVKELYIFHLEDLSLTKNVALKAIICFVCMRTWVLDKIWQRTH